MHISLICISTLKNVRPTLDANSKTNKTKQNRHSVCSGDESAMRSTCMAALIKQPPGQLLLILFLLMYAMSQVMVTVLFHSYK